MIVSAAGDELGVASGGDAVAERLGDGTSVGVPIGTDPAFAAAQPAKTTVNARGRSLRTLIPQRRLGLGDQRDAPDGSSTDWSLGAAKILRETCKCMTCITRRTWRRSFVA